MAPLLTVLPLLLGILVGSKGDISPKSVSQDISHYGYNRSFDEKQGDKEVLDHLVHSTRYDKRIKPPLTPIVVNVSVGLLSLSSPDESSLNYEVEFLLHLKWEDPRLAHRHDTRRKGHVHALSHHSKIWKPDIYLIKHGTYKGINPREVDMKILQNGTVSYTLRRHLVLNCEGDLQIFPFDSPMCDFNIESISNTRSQMEFFWWGPNQVEFDPEKGYSTGTINLSPIQKNHNAYMIFNETLYCGAGEEWRGDFSCLKVRLHFTRDKWFYYTTVFVPGMILVTSSFVTFFIEWNAEPARVMLGVTTMLNFFTTSNKFRSKLPVVSSLTAMNMWDAVCMFFIYASFLEFILVNYLARWVQDPEAQEKRKENKILESLKIVRTTFDLKHPNREGTLGSNLQAVEHKIKETIMRGSGALQIECQQEVREIEDEDEVRTNGRYSLADIKKIDNYARGIFPVTYLLFVLYFFIRYHAVMGELSINLMQ